MCRSHVSSKTLISCLFQKNMSSVLFWICWRWCFQNFTFYRGKSEPGGGFKDSGFQFWRTYFSEWVEFYQLRSEFRDWVLTFVSKHLIFCYRSRPPEFAISNLSGELKAKEAKATRTRPVNHPRRPVILLMAEILHHLGCMKPYK